MGKKVLIITYYWPPCGGSGVQRWVKFTKYLPSFGWEPVIYTPENPDMTLVDNTLEKDIPPQTTILKAPIIEPYTLFRKIVGKKEGTSGVNPINNTSDKSLKMRLSLWVRANLFIPDPKFLWIKPSVKILSRYLKENEIDLIISTGPPHSMHLIAKKIAKKFNIRWIADFRDPWTKIFYFKHLPLTKIAKKRYNTLEKRVLLEADAIVTVSDPIREEFERMIKSFGGRTPVYTVENGYDESDFPTEEITMDHQFTFLHTGLFAQEGNPESLWKVLGDLTQQIPIFKRDLLVKLIGKVDREVLDNVLETLPQENLYTPGYLPHNEVNIQQMSARILLLPLRKEPEAAGILTGKYFEYLASGRPIIAFGPKESALNNSLSLTGAGVIFDWDNETELKEYILREYMEFLKERGAKESEIDAIDSIRKTIGCTPVVKKDYSVEEVKKFSRRLLTAKIAKIFPK